MNIPKEAVGFILVVMISCGIYVLTHKDAEEVAAPPSVVTTATNSQSNDEDFFNSVYVDQVQAQTDKRLKQDHFMTGTDWQIQYLPYTDTFVIEHKDGTRLISIMQTTKRVPVSLTYNCSNRTVRYDDPNDWTPVKANSPQGYAFVYACKLPAFPD